MTLIDKNYWEDMQKLLEKIGNLNFYFFGSHDHEKSTSIPRLVILSFWHEISKSKFTKILSVFLVKSHLALTIVLFTGACTILIAKRIKKLKNFRNFMFIFLILNATSYSYFQKLTHFEENDISKNLLKIFTHYDENFGHKMTQQIQYSGKCCGVHGAMDWTSSASNGKLHEAFRRFYVAAGNSSSSLVSTNINLINFDTAVPDTCCEQEGLKLNCGLYNKNTVTSRSSLPHKIEMPGEADENDETSRRLNEREKRLEKHTNYLKLKELYSDHDLECYSKSSSSCQTLIRNLMDYFESSNEKTASSNSNSCQKLIYNEENELEITWDTLAFLDQERIINDKFLYSNNLAINYIGNIHDQRSKNDSNLHSNLLVVKTVDTKIISTGCASKFSSKYKNVTRVIIIALGVVPILWMLVLSQIIIRKVDNIEANYANQNRSGRELFDNLY